MTNETHREAATDATGDRGAGGRGAGAHRHDRGRAGEGRRDPGHHHDHGAEASESRDEAPAAFWERKYSATDRVWSGRVNRTLADTVAGWRPGRSLDLGSGEGGDVLWLAEAGWDALGIELSPTAVARAREVLRERGLVNARFVVGDLGEWAAGTGGSAGAGGGGGAGAGAGDGAGTGADPVGFDLITASFLQSPVELPRERILRAALERLAVGGRLVVIAHAAPPPWARDHPGDFLTPQQEVEKLDLDASRWRVQIAETRRRAATGPAGEASDLEDALVVVQRVA